jgi:hypothetical protein
MNVSMDMATGHAKSCDYLWRHRNQLYRLTSVKAATQAPTTAQYILSKVKGLGMPLPMDMLPMDMSIPPIDISILKQSN